MAVAVETKSGTVVESIFYEEIDCCIFPVHPQSARAYRQRKVPSGNKTDHVDAWSLAQMRQCGWMEPTGSNCLRRSR